MIERDYRAVPLEHRLQLLREMIRIRAYEESIAAVYTQGQMRCPTHLSTGQEGVPAVMSCLLKKTDLAISTHRAHAHYLGKGGSGPKMLAEIYGKADGCAHGKGGSMHLIDLSVGFKGSTAIVGNTIPVGVGIGLALKMNGQKDVACVFVGDAAVEEGAFYEAANFAALKKLPVFFICENNMYSVYSHLRVRQPEGRRIFEMVKAMGIESTEVDGNDPIHSYLTTQRALLKLRGGEGPQFIEYSTYRWREHCGPNFDNDIGYRTEAEYLEWKKRDPVQRLKSEMIENGDLDEKKFKSFEQDAEAEVQAAHKFAAESRFPEAQEAFQHLFAEVKS